jgi:uncharacterized ferritin-like protein (DUF455 family)
MTENSPQIQSPSCPEWEHFWVVQDFKLQPHPRPLHSVPGVLDRIRLVAFAELQAREGFLWAAHQFRQSATPELIARWQSLAQDENRHYTWLVDYSKQLAGDLKERPVCDSLWLSLTRCTSPEEFTNYVCNAEERGRVAGHRFAESLRPFDPKAAEIFERIADEEVAHVAVAQVFFPHLPKPTGEGRKR